MSEPVTLGGGMEMTKGFPDPARGRKTPCSSQNAYQRGSIRPVPGLGASAPLC